MWRNTLVPLSGTMCQMVSFYLAHCARWQYRPTDEEVTGLTSTEKPDDWSGAWVGEAFRLSPAKETAEKLPAAYRFQGGFSSQFPCFGVLGLPRVRVAAGIGLGTSACPVI